MFRYIPMAEFVDACGRIDPNTEDLREKAKALMDQGPYFTLAMAVVQIADDQPGLRKPIGSAAPQDTPKSFNKRSIRL